MQKDLKIKKNKYDILALLFNQFENGNLLFNYVVTICYSGV